MINMSRLAHAADALRDMASSPQLHDTEKLLALANELDQFRREIPPFVDFAHAVLSKYTPSN